MSLPRIPLPLSTLTLTAALLTLAACSDDPALKPGGDEVPKLPLALTGGTASALCAGGTQTLTASPSGGVEPYAFSWTSEPDCGGCIADPTSPTPTVSPAAATVFKAKVTDAEGAQVTASIPVDVFALPSVTVGAEQTTDPGAGVTLEGSAPGAGASVLWSCNRQDCALSDAALEQPQAIPTRSTRYTYSITSAQGCSASADTTVWVNLKAVSTLPRDGELAWPVSSSLVIEFDQPLDPASVTGDSVKLEEATSALSIPVTTAVSGDGRFLYVTPGTGYAAEADYVLTVSAGLLSLDPVLPNRLTSDVVLSFSTTVADNTPPAITYRLPPVDAVNVPLNTAVVVSFDEQLDPVSVDATSVQLTDSNGPLSGALGWNPATRSITLVPDAPLATNAIYTVQLDGLADLSGNTLTTSWSFTTGSELDTTPPSVVSVSPAAGETAVSANSPVVVTFSELIDASVLSGISVTRSADGQPASGSITFDPASFAATWTPSGILDSLTEYTVTVQGFRDMAGNVMPAPFVSTFTTRQVLFSDDFESGPGNWTFTGTWGLSNVRAHSPGFSLSDTPVGRYLPNASGTARTTNVLDVTGYDSVTVQYWARQQSQKNADHFTVYYRLDGGDWVEAHRFAGIRDWTSLGFTLDSTGATALEVKFEFESNDRPPNLDGVYVDDVLIQTP